jgi:hypothetical protein
MRKMIFAAVVGMMSAGWLELGAASAHPALDSTAGPPPITSQQPKLPPPPRVQGCYVTGGDSWHGVTCASQQFISLHFPHPEVLSGVGGKSIVSGGKTVTAAPFKVGVIRANPLIGGAESDTLLGAGNYSLQDNVFFKGSNGEPDGVQFTDQTVSGTNGVCVWQINIKTQNYNDVHCNSVSLDAPAAMVEGWDWGGELGVAVAALGGSEGIAVVTSDDFGMGSKDRWNNNSGSILGVGKGSEAVFSSTEEYIGDEVSSCPNDAGFIAFSVFCSSQSVKPLAYTGYSPGPMTQIGAKQYFTVETNNLAPVIGSPPKHLPPIEYFGPYVAQTVYVASTSGKCLSGTPPYCS